MAEFSPADAITQCMKRFENRSAYAMGFLKLTSHLVVKQQGKDLQASSDVSGNGSVIRRKRKSKCIDHQKHRHVAFSASSLQRLTTSVIPGHSHTIQSIHKKVFRGSIVFFTIFSLNIAPDYKTMLSFSSQHRRDETLRLYRVS